MNWTLMIHGGCGAMRPATLSPEHEAEARRGLDAALDAGGTVLGAGGDALDAVEAAARVLEDDPSFNAGRGCVLSADGRAELDAAIMDGRDRRAGAVAGMTTTRSPISAARAVMEHSPHVLLTYDGADILRGSRAWSRSRMTISSRPDGGRSLTGCWPPAARSTPTSNMARSARSRWTCMVMSRRQHRPVG